MLVVWPELDSGPHTREPPLAPLPRWRQTTRVEPTSLGLARSPQSAEQIGGYRHGRVTTMTPTGELPVKLAGWLAWRALITTTTTRTSLAECPVIVDFANNDDNNNNKDSSADRGYHERRSVVVNNKCDLHYGRSLGVLCWQCPIRWMSGRIYDGRDNVVIVCVCCPSATPS